VAFPGVLRGGEGACRFHRSAGETHTCQVKLQLTSVGSG
jgi:hypothetical protein